MTIKTLPLHANGHRVTGNHGDGTVKAMTHDNEPTWPPMLMSHLFSCQGCGEYLSPRMENDGAYIDTSCQVTDGLITTVRLNFPSGKIIVSTDLRPAYDGYDHGNRAEYGSTLGVAQTIEAFAAQGCAFGFVGDRWPDLYQTGEGTYVLAHSWLDDDDQPSVPSEWVQLAEVSGAVWSYSIADYADWKARGGTDNELEEFTVVEIPAGVYEFTYHGGEKDFDRESSETVIFTEIKKVA